MSYTLIFVATVLNGVNRQKNDSDLLISSDLDLIRWRSLKTDWFLDYAQPCHKVSQRFDQWFL